MSMVVKDNGIDENYVDWLFDFMFEKGTIVPDDLIYDMMFSDVDKKNISKIKDFYDDVERYARDNNIKEAYSNYNYATYLISNGLMTYSFVKTGDGNKDYAVFNRKEFLDDKRTIDVNEMVKRKRLIKENLNKK